MNDDESSAPPLDVELEPVTSRHLQLVFVLYDVLSKILFIYRIAQVNLVETCSLPELSCRYCLVLCSVKLCGRQGS